MKAGPVLYGLAFVVGVPALLVAWAAATAPVVELPAVRSLPAGLALAIAGLGLMAAGMAALWVHGRGLPMNAYPPPRWVGEGAYRWLAHPIYTGFCLACAGAAIATGSASGLWLVTPATILGCVALVLGHERADLERRFGHARRAPVLGLPPDSDHAPTIGDRMSAYALVLAPWLVGYEAAILVGVPADALSTLLPFERRWPVLEWTELVYASTYPLVILAPLVARTAGDLRRFMLRGAVAMAIVFPLFFTLPLYSPPRPFEPHGPLGRLLLLERAYDTPAAAFPSFHVVWALVAAETWARRWPRARRACFVYAALIAASCVTTGMHALADMAAGLVVGVAALRYDRLWDLLRRGAERLANAWREWRWGSVRFLAHGLLAGLATASGLAIAATFLGGGGALVLLVTAGAGLLGAALWAQIVEGSADLLRPFGFYGSLCGVLVGALAAPFSGLSPWLVLASFAVAAPAIQGIGRLRCLVHGCCHGRPAPPELGIRYFHPRTRVARLAGLAGLPLHATPLYSMLWNLMSALALVRIALLQTPTAFVAGVYLILNGLGRFVEEAFRGEPQTPVVAGLRIYQWLALASILTGISFTMVRGAPMPPPESNAVGLAVAILFGILGSLAMGLDLPGSSRRFSRLA